MPRGKKIIGLIISLNLFEYFNMNSIVESFVVIVPSKSNSASSIFKITPLVYVTKFLDYDSKVTSKNMEIYPMKKMGVALPLKDVITLELYLITSTRNQLLFDN